MYDWTGTGIYYLKKNVKKKKPQSRSGKVAELRAKIVTF